MFVGKIWRTKFLNFQRCTSIFKRDKHLHTDLSTFKKALLGLPVVVGGAGVILGGSYVVANVAINWKRTSMTYWKGRERGGTYDVTETAKVSPVRIPRAEVEDFLSRSFTEYASFALQGEMYMTAADFINFISEGTCINKGSQTTIQGHNNYMEFTNSENQELRRGGEVPRLWKNSSHLIRDLKDGGVISFSDFVLLLYILTNPPDFFKPIFKVLTAERTLLTAKDFEYMKLAISPKPKNMKTQKSWSLKSAWSASSFFAASCQGFNHLSTIIVDDSKHLSSHYSNSSIGKPVMSSVSKHLFGPKQEDTIRFVDFKKFVLNIQEETLEVEFNVFAGHKGFLTIHDFALWLFRFSNKSDGDQVKILTDRLANTSHCASDVQFTLEDIRTIQTLLLYHLGRLHDAINLYTIASPGGLSSHYALAEAIHVASGLGVETYVAETLFHLFYDPKAKSFDVERFCDILHERKNFGLPLKVKDDG